MGDLTKQVEEQLAEARSKVVRAVGMPIVATIEGLELTIVSKWMIETLMKSVKKVELK